MNAKTRYWTMFNVLGRVVGLGFVVAGAVVLVFGATQRDWLIGISGSVVAVLGFCSCFPGLITQTCKSEYDRGLV